MEKTKRVVVEKQITATEVAYRMCKKVIELSLDDRKNKLASVYADALNTAKQNPNIDTVGAVAVYELSFDPNKEAVCSAVSGVGIVSLLKSDDCSVEIKNKFQYVSDVLKKMTMTESRVMFMGAWLLNPI
jgi:hypothetical protein